MPRRKTHRPDTDSTKSPHFAQAVQPQQVVAQQKTTSPLLSAFQSASSLPFNLLGNSPPPPAAGSPQQLPQQHLLGTSPSHPYHGDYVPSGQISIPNSFPRSFNQNLAAGGGGTPHAISPPTGYHHHGTPDGRMATGGTPVRGFQQYPSYPEHRGSSVYATSPTPSHLSGRGGVGGGTRPPAHAGHLSAGDGGWAFSFDVLDDLEGNIAEKAGGSGVGGTDVICLGWEGGVDVWKVGRGVVELLSRMSGLPGTVVGAKILPTPRRDDPQAHLRPLICLVMHSPVLPQDDETRSEKSPTPSEGSRPASAASDRSEHLPQIQAEEYQTSVEIYSLSRRTHVATLYKSPLIPVGIGGIPAPLGIRIEVSAIGGLGNVVAAGIAGTGEVFLFGDTKPSSSRKRRSASHSDGSWHCWGKVWTNVYVEGRGSSSGNLAADYNGENVPTAKAGMPIFSLEGRYLAYCPPSPSTQALRTGTHFPSVGGTATGAPQLPYPSTPQPVINTYVDVPEDEPILNRVAREVTQQVITGAKWMGEQGIRAMKNYWSGYTGGSSNSNGNSPPGSTGIKIGPNPAGSNGVSALGMQVQEMRERERELASLGPGGGISAGKNGYGGLQSGSSPLATANSSEPVVISIMDLGKGMAQSARNEALTPQTTFQPLQGASFLSFAPGGTTLLVVSNKGDVVHVWDLLKAMHQPPTSATSQSKTGKAASGATDASSIAVNGRLPNGHHAGRHVRQIARFTRMTVAHVLDVVWSRPKSDKLAIITEKGTVHFYDMPGNAYQWPPPKRTLPQPKSPQGGVGGIVNSASQAATSLLTNAQPLVVAARRRRRSSSAGSGGYGTSTGKDSTLGSSHNSVAAANNVVHRVSLPHGPGTPGMSCVRFLGGKEFGFVAMIGGGTLRIYESKNSAIARRKSASHDGGVVTTGWLEYELPGLPDGTAAGVQADLFDEDDENPASPVEGERAEPVTLQGYWGGKTTQPSAAATTSGKNKDPHALQKELLETPLSYAEIDTNPPYPPIHSDRHVTLSVFKDEPTSIAASATWHLNVAPSNEAAWVFGRPLPFENLDVGFAKGEVEFVDGSDGLAEAMESGMRIDGNGRTHSSRGVHNQSAYGQLIYGAGSGSSRREHREHRRKVSTPPEIAEVVEEPPMLLETPSTTTVDTMPALVAEPEPEPEPVYIAPPAPAPVKAPVERKKKKKKGKAIDPAPATVSDEGFFEEGADLVDENRGRK